jgi:hypothetical protein
VLRLDPGDLVLESITGLIRHAQLHDGVVVSGIGTLDRCVLHMVTTTGYPPEEHFARLEDVPLELASLQGVIADGVAHLHAVVSDRSQAYAGHLEPGCRILYLGEVVIREHAGLPLCRVPNQLHIQQLALKRG